MLKIDASRSIERKPDIIRALPQFAFVKVASISTAGPHMPEWRQEVKTKVELIETFKYAVRLKIRPFFCIDLNAHRECETTPNIGKARRRDETPRLRNEGSAVEILLNE